ncbi:MAG: non-heme iron oxygenase ferredoxin subunit [Gemmatimonadetes bacterium]|nr:non-heme iron oxygenase ferredoxin subunit [Gemmatimonadota bacterium]
MSEFVPASRLEDIPENGMKGVMIGGTAVVLINREGTIYALEDCCSHEEFPLSSGDLVGSEVTCALHGARFDIETGAPRALPAVMPVRTFEVQIDDGEVRVALD